MRALPPEEARGFIDACKDDRYQTLFALSLVTGCFGGVHSFEVERP